MLQRSTRSGNALQFTNKKITSNSNRCKDIASCELIKIDLRGNTQSRVQSTNNTAGSNYYIIHPHQKNKEQ